MNPRDFFSSADREAIRQAAADAESGTAGEVVPYVVGRCDDYGEAAWKGAALLGLLAAVGTAIADRQLGFWGEGASITALAAGFGVLGGYLAVRTLPTLARWLTPAGILEERVRRRAEAAFLEEEVFNTRDRTGVLLFLALFEHRVVVLGDEGINRAVEPEEWGAITESVAAGIRAAQPASALVDAIGACGKLLAERRVERRPDDDNELADDLRMRDE